MTERKAICISHEGNYHCTHCGAHDFFTVCEDSRPGNPAMRDRRGSRFGFCPFCGARFTHVMEVDDLYGYEGWSDGDD